MHARRGQCAPVPPVQRGEGRPGAAAHGFRGISGSNVRLREMRRTATADAVRRRCGWVLDAGQLGRWPCLWPPHAGRPTRTGAPGMAWHMATRSTGPELKACAGICGSSAAPPWGRAATNRFGSLEGATCPPGRGGRSAAHARAVERMQGRSVIHSQLAGRIRARACTVRTETGLTRVPKH